MRRRSWADRKSVREKHFAIGHERVVDRQLARRFGIRVLWSPARDGPADVGANKLPLTKSRSGGMVRPRPSPQPRLLWRAELDVIPCLLMQADIGQLLRLVSSLQLMEIERQTA